MSDQGLKDSDVAKLIRFAAVLIPASGKMPSATDIPGFAGLLQTSAKACHYTSAELRSVLDAIPADPSLANAEAWFKADPVRFDSRSSGGFGNYCCFVPESPDPQRRRSESHEMVTPADTRRFQLPQ